jgi:hypothetical protein
MTGERSWEDLIKELEKMKELGPLEAIWFATQGSEDSGIWLLRPEGDPLRSRFSLFAARAIAKLGIPPAAVPEPEEYCPHWRASCEAEQELARKKGISLDLSDAVPYGLGKVDEDAVDGCTRAWLELLRQERHAFRIPRYGTETIKGQQYKTLSGGIKDVWAASLAYVNRRARDEIGGQLAGTTRKTLPDTVVSRPAPRELVDAAKRRGRRSYETLAGRIGIGKDTLYAIRDETRWVSDDSYALVAQQCSCRPEDLHPRDIPPPKRRRRQ